MYAWKAFTGQWACPLTVSLDFEEVYVYSFGQLFFFGMTQEDFEVFPGMFT